MCSSSRTIREFDRACLRPLTALGFVVGEAGDGEGALVRLRMIDYDAVLLDINMPGMGGIENMPQNSPQLPPSPHHYAYSTGRGR